MIQNYLNQLINAIKNTDEVQKQPRLIAEGWNNSSYILLSKIIAEKLQEKLSDKQRQEMGGTISYKTLTKIFEKNYRPTLPIDRRSINTLNKLAIFVNYSDWDSFISMQYKKNKATMRKATEEEQILQIVKDGINQEFITYTKLPSFNTDNLKKIFPENSGAFKRIEEIVHVKNEANEIISNKYNSSTFEILSIRLVDFSDKTAKVETEEFWTLCWWNQKMKQYVQRFKSKAEHIYILKKENGQWTIKTNATVVDLLDFKNNGK